MPKYLEQNLLSVTSLSFHQLFSWTPFLGETHTYAKILPVKSTITHHSASTTVIVLDSTSFWRASYLYYNTSSNPLSLTSLCLRCSYFLGLHIFLESPLPMLKYFQLLLLSLTYLSFHQSYLLTYLCFHQTYFLEFYFFLESL